MDTHLCPHCAQPLDTATQHWTHRAPSILVTCRNAGCAVHNVTATLDSMTETFSAYIAAPAPVAVAS